MANECLVTKLKGTVDNNNLPVYGKAFLSYLVNPGEPDDVSVSSAVILMADKNFTAKFKVPVTAYQGPTKTEFSLSANIPYYFSTTKADIMEYGNEFVEVSDIYNIKAFDIITNNIVKTPHIAAATSKSNLASILKYSNPVGICIDIADFDKIPTSARYIQVATYSGLNTNVDIANVLANPNIDLLVVYGSGFNFGVVNLSRDMSNSPITYLGAQVRGDLLYLPNNIKLFTDMGSVQNPTRSIEEIVNKMRTAGRTTGAINIWGAKYSYLQYKGQTLRSQFGTEDVPAYNNVWGMAILTWTPTSIEFVDSLPEELTGYNNIPVMTTWIASHNANQ